jgi:transposase
MQSSMSSVRSTGCPPHNAAPYEGWEAFTRFLEDGRICLTNNAAERALRGIALGRKAWLRAGSDRGDERAAAMCSLIVTCKLHDIDPQTYLADVLDRIVSGRTKVNALRELLP